MATFYLSPDGSDDNDGTSADSAFQTFQHAADTMATSRGADTTIVGQGLYVLDTTVLMDGVQYSGSSFVEAEGETAIITATRGEFGLFGVKDAIAVTFDGLTFRGVTTQSEDAIDLSPAIALGRSAFVNIVNNDFQNLPSGVWLDDQSQHIRIDGNNFLNIGGHAIEVTAGSHENTITNNTMRHTGYQFAEAGDQTATITLGETWGNLIAHNEITDVAHFGIGEWNTTEEFESGGNLIEYNILSKTGQKIEDTGGIYIFSSDDQAHGGSVIRYNSITDTGVDTSWGIYLDDLTNNAEVYGNYITGAKVSAAMIHGGDDNEWSGNIFLNSDQFGFEFLEIGDRSMAGNSIHHNVIATPNDDGSQLISLPRELVDPSNIYENVYQSLNPRPPTGDGTWEQWIALGGDVGSVVVPSAGEFNAQGQFILSDATVGQGIEQLPWDEMGNQDSDNRPPPDWVIDGGGDGGEVTPQTLSLILSGTAYQDRIDPEFIVFLDGDVLGGGSVDADHGDGQRHSVTFNFLAEVDAGPHVLEIGFVNANAAPAGAISLDIQDVIWGGSNYGPVPDVTLTDRSFYEVSLISS